MCLHAGVKMLLITTVCRIWDISVLIYLYIFFNNLQVDVANKKTGKFSKKMCLLKCKVAV